MNGVECVIRRCAGTDLDSIRLIHAAHAEEALAAASPVETATWGRMMATGDLTVYIAESDGTPAGTATVMLMPNITRACAPTAFIEAVVVVPSLRRRGIARSILKRVISDARSAGCDKVQLLSHKRHHDDGAHDLYRGLGFAPEAEGFRLYLIRPAEDRNTARPT